MSETPNVPQSGGSIPGAQLQRLVAAADEIGCGLDVLCNAISRADESFLPVYAAVNRAADAIMDWRESKGWTAGSGSGRNDGLPNPPEGGGR